ncbi:MAG: hypothetical protein AVDCRST_MAG76-2960 [uncultured Acidimicrobiales bacterium]|uniref:Uncharacterized protein n=1 Tax=uncultured Acidimicrobiales bacterium TaxID=310071 RepID=A0A6J4IX65_9ACTN|nr:MAG: hypothetical protein AVDCRST_MAG76-2960 [uncultured Acidimicrobiales bacterium]
MAGLAACIVFLFGAGVVGALTVEEGEAASNSGGSPPVTEPGPPAPPIDLAAVIVPGPAGFDQIPDARLQVGGPVDVERLAAERGDQTKAVFQETRLVNGFVRAWQNPTTLELATVRLYQFADEAGAASYSKRVVQAMSKAPASTFVVPATTDTVGIDTRVDQGANRVAYVFTRRGRVVAAIAAASAQPVEAGFLPAFARSQLSLLPQG